MKKILCFVLIMAMGVLMVACGGDASSETVKGNGEQNAVTDGGVNLDNDAETNVKKEVTIDEVALALGLTGGEETFYNMIGAIDGKEYNGGNVELYQFDEDSSDYKKMISGEGVLKPAAYKDGIVLLFALGVQADTELVDAFNELEF